MMLKMMIMKKKKKKIMMMKKGTLVHTKECSTSVNLLPLSTVQLTVYYLFLRLQASRAVSDAL
jgi:hypothetical protein